MKNRHFNLLSRFSIVVAMSAVSSASAQITGAWNVNAAGSWGTAANWTSNPDIPGTTLAGGDSASVTFDITAARTITLDAERHLGSLTVGDSAAALFAYTLSAGTSGRINFNSGTAAPATLTFPANIASTISAPTTLTSDLRFIDLATAGVVRTISGVISGSKSITFDNDDGITAVAPLNQVGQITLSGANTAFSGGITIQDVRVGASNSNGFGTGLVKVLPGGQAHVATTVAVSTNFEITGDGWQENIGKLGALRLAPSGTVNGNVTITGTPGNSLGITPDASLGTFAIGTGAATSTVNGVISGGDALFGTFTPGAVGFTGAETLSLNNANTYGDTIISAYSLPPSGETLLSIGNGTANTTATLGTGNVYLYGGSAGRTTGLRIWRSGGYTLTQDILTMTGPELKTAFLVDVTDPGLTTNGRTINVSEQIRVGTNANGATLNIDAATQVNAAQFMTGNAANNSTTVNQTGGTVNITGAVRVALFSAESSVWNLSGGTLNLTGLPTANPFTTGATEATDGPGTLYIGINGQGLFNQTGGIVNAAAVVLDNRDNTPAGANMPTGIDTYLLAGGVLNLGSDVTNGNWGISGNPTSSFEFAGGTLNLGTSLPISTPIAVTGTSSILDTKGFTATLSGPLSGAGTLAVIDSTNTTGSLTVSPTAPSSVGGFTGSLPMLKTGSGLLTITGTAPRTGTNLISAGGLQITGTLAGDTTVQGATLWTGGTLAGNLTLGSSANSTVRYDGTPLQINGNLTFAPASTNLVQPVGSAPIASGTYPLIQYSGTLSGTLANLQIDPAAAASYRQTFGLTSTGNTINLTVAGISSKALSWAGTSTLWDVNATSSWASGPTPEKFFQLDDVTITDIGTLLDIELVGELQPGSITVDASANQYWVIGTGSIVGNAPLLKKGTEKFRITPGNPLWNGPITIANGELEGVIGNSLGTGSITFGDASTAADAVTRITWLGGTSSTPSVTVNPQALEARLVSTGATVNIASIVKQGPGRLTIGHPTYTETTSYFTGLTGGILVEQGTLAFSSRTPIPTGTAITLGNLNTGNVNTIIDLARSNQQDGLVLSADITLGTLASGATSQAILRYSGVAWSGNESTSAPSLQGTVNLNGRKLYVENTSRGPGANATRLWNLSAPISGNGDVHIRNGTLADGNTDGGARSRLNAANTWTGDLYIDTGAVQLAGGAANALNAIPDNAVVYMAPGTRLGFGSNGDVIAGLVGGGASGDLLPATIDDMFGANTSSFTLNLAGSGTYVFDGIFRRIGVGGVAGTGRNNITKSGSGTQVFNGASTNTGTITITGGTLAVGHDDALGTGTVNLNNAGAILRAASAAPRTLANPITYSTDFTLGSPDTGNLTFTGTVNVGGLPKAFNIQNAITTFTGVISGSGTPARTKEGPGTLIFGGASTYPGSTVVNAGSLLVTNTTGSGTGTSTVTVNSGGTLGGTGSLTGAVSTLGGTIAPGTSGVGTLTTDALTLDPTATLAIQFDSSGTPAADSLFLNASATLENATLALSDVATTPAPLPNGTKFVLIDPATPVTGTFAGIPNGGVTTATGGQQFIVRYDDAGKVTLEATSGAATAYDTWASSFGLNPLTTGAPGEDPDKDGIPNGIEFIIGANPNTASNNDPGYPTGQVIGNNLLFTFKRSEVSKAYEVRVETSTDLASWPPAASYLIPTVTTVGLPVTVVDDSPATADDVTVTIPMGADPKKFARLRLITP